MNVQQKSYLLRDASLDADTGEILNMSRRNNTPVETKGIIQKQEAQKTAEQFIQKLQPERFKNNSFTFPIPIAIGIFVIQSVLSFSY